MLLRLTTISLLAGSLLMGLAHIAQLPPWEGFDETAHYSYLQQLATTGAWPRFGDRLSAEVEQYLEVAPGALSLNSKWSYREFFAAPVETITLGHNAIEAARKKDRLWRAGQAINWEAPQPPLYYAVLTPFYRLSEAWSVKRQLLLLRSVSYFVAWVALCIGAAFAYRRYGNAAAMLAPALWPIIFPMWFPEMARLGNDSLVALWVAGAWMALTRVSTVGASIRPYALAGLCCGFGLLTKATFLPLSGVAASWLIWRAWKKQAQWRGVIVFAVLVTAVSGWWYLGKLIETGTLTGLHVFAVLQRSGGLLQASPHFENPYPIWRIAASMLNSFLWVGTWSFVLPPFISKAPLLLLAVALGGAYLAQMTSGNVRGAEWIGPWTIAVFLVGIVYVSFIVIMAGGRVGFSIWYLHSYVALLAPMVAIALALLMSARHLRAVTAGLLIYPLVFLPLAIATLTLFYAGLGVKKEGTPYFEFPSLAPDAKTVSAIYANLSVLSEPELFAALFIAGWLLATVGVFCSIRALWAEAT
jgi:hypothetical protein